MSCDEDFIAMIIEMLDSKHLEFIVVACSIVLSSFEFEADRRGRSDRENSFHDAPYAAWE